LYVLFFVNKKLEGKRGVKMRITGKQGGEGVGEGF
jgi:hypothetical protein